LFIDVDALNRASFDVTTDFDGISGRRASVTGTNPTHKMESSGLVVATATAVESTTRETKGRARKTIAVGRRETGEAPLVTALPAITEITTPSMKGKFLFSKEKPDQVSFSGTIELPAGLNIRTEQQFSIGLGNVIEVLTVDAKGKATSTGTAGRVKKLRFKYPKVDKTTGLTTAGQVAKLTITMSTENMDLKGFDTEGITTALRTDEAGQKTVPREIQVAMVLGGVAYEALVPVSFKLSTSAESGQMSSRK